VTALVELIAKGLVREQVPLSPLTTYKVGGPARYYADVGSSQDLDAVATALRGTEIPILVLGRGSNVVVSDTGFPGLVIRLYGEFNESRIDPSGVVDAGAAVSLPALARFAVRHDRGGLEFFVGVPGSVGGAVRMNAGCHGSEVVDWLVTADVIDLSTGQRSERTPVDLGLEYRASNLADWELTIRARFRTVPRPRADGEAVMREITRWRKEHQPGGTHNAGSVFKNPSGDAAGRIIDQIGLKGFRVGRVAVSERHANFFVAEEGATAQEIYELVHAVRARVGEATGVWLTSEIRFVGEFSSVSERT
jgi:UDP-N-acetylmuramate dehydrogenase